MTNQSSSESESPCDLALTGEDPFWLFLSLFFTGAAGFRLMAQMSSLLLCIRRFYKEKRYGKSGYHKEYIVTLYLLLTCTCTVEPLIKDPQRKGQPFYKGHFQYRQKCIMQYISTFEI